MTVAVADRTLRSPAVAHDAADFAPVASPAILLPGRRAFLARRPLRGVRTPRSARPPSSNPAPHGTPNSAYASTQLWRRPESSQASISFVAARDYARGRRPG